MITADHKDSAYINIHDYQKTNRHYSYDHYTNKTATSHYSRENQNLHPFDLNTATPSELSERGFSERQIASVMKYRSKGGIYRQPEQMSKISGMTKGQYDALLPYFTVSEEFRPASDFVQIEHKQSKEQETEGNNDQNYLKYPPKLTPNEIDTICLNSADTTMLMKIPEIGSFRAKQIIRHRERLGGFYSLSQLNDLKNLPVNTHKYFRLDTIPLKQIQINKLTINQLVNHPYISFFQASVIYEYRQKHGNIKSLSELNFNKNFTESAIKRLEPYIKYE